MQVDNKYIDIYSNVLNADVRNHLSEDILDPILKTYNTILNLYRKKPEENQEMVKKGFFKIMNDQIASKDNLKDKLDILNQWNSAVYKTVIANSDNLMFIEIAYRNSEVYK